MPDALDALAETLSRRVDAYWEWFDDVDGWGSVENRFGSADDWENVKSGAEFLWQKAGWKPEIMLPRPTLRSPRSDDSFRSSVAFDDVTTDYWFSDSTAIFFGTMDWGSWRSENVTVMPSLGQTCQYASGLLGAFRVGVIEQQSPRTRNVDGNGLPQVWVYVDVGWDPAGTIPIWERIAHMAPGKRSTKNVIPTQYQSNFEIGDHGFLDLDEFLIFLLPDDLRSPHAMPLMSAVSYSLGWLALTYGLKVVVDEWEGVNQVLTSTPLQGFAPSD